MIITESKLRQIIEEETLIYLALNEGVLTENLLKRLAVKYGLPAVAIASIWTNVIKNDAPIDVAAEAAGISQDVAAQVVQDLPAEKVAPTAEKRTREEIKDFLDNATEQDLSAEEFDAIVGFQNAFNEKLGQNLSQEELLFQWFSKSPAEQKQLLGQFSIGEKEKAEIMQGLEQIKVKMSPIKFKDTPPSFDVPKPPTGIA